MLFMASEQMYFDYVRDVRFACGINAKPSLDAS